MNSKKSGAFGDMSDSRATYDPTAPEPIAAPTDPRKRLELVDALRGFALFGILIVNIGDFTLHWGLSDEQRAALSTAGMDEIAQFLLSDVWTRQVQYDLLVPLRFGLRDVHCAWNTRVTRRF
jgi:uncharacterized protein